MDEKKCNIAIFGDTHGHLRLMFQLCRLWQLQQGEHLDIILQCGDLGFFPDPGRLDSATKKFEKRDPEELGFAYYFRFPEPVQRDPLMDRILLGEPSDLNTVSAPVVFCHGNHEDFPALQAITGGSPMATVDYYRRLHYLPSGCITTLPRQISLAALGGAPEPEGENRGHAEKYVNPQAARRLERRQVSILLTHGGPHPLSPQHATLGSPAIEQVIHRSQPAYHFYGHHGGPVPPQQIGSTLSVWFNDVSLCPIKTQG